MKAKNKVIAGDYVRYTVSSEFKSISINYGLKSIRLDGNSVACYTLVTEDIRKSAMSGIIRGYIGSAFLGKAGLLAGLSAKNVGIYLVAVQFKDGKNSLLELDEKLYKKLVIALISTLHQKPQEVLSTPVEPVQLETKEQKKDSPFHPIAMPSPIENLAQVEKVNPVDKLDIINQIKRLGELRDKGILTESEFEGKKALLLAQI